MRIFPSLGNRGLIGRRGSASNTQSLLKRVCLEIFPRFFDWEVRFVEEASAIEEARAQEEAPVFKEA